VTADRLHARDVQRPYGSVVVTGRPAHFEARGLALSGSNINLNRGANRLWIDGAGQMDVPIDRGLDGEPLAKPGSLQVLWQDRMEFDGRTARFEEAVTASGSTQNLQTETLEVQFRQPVRFDQSTSDQKPEVENILCRGGVLLSNRSFDQGRQTSQEQVHVTDMSLNLRSGALTAGGPGWINSVRSGSDQWLAAGGPAERTALRQPAPAAADRQTLKCLHVRFRGSVNGNLGKLGPRQLIFQENVQAAYAPVDSWLATIPVDEPDALGPKGVTLRCDRLTMTDMPGPLQGDRSIELEAAGNIIAEGSQFTARAVRMTYAEAKGLLVLEGDGRVDAELYRQAAIGAPTSTAAARKILYWPRTGRLQVEGARSLELTQFPAKLPGQ
jgi:hypothetical protein